MRANNPVDSDTLQQGAKSRAGEHTSRGALPQRAGQLRRQTPREPMSDIALIPDEVVSFKATRRRRCRETGGSMAMRLLQAWSQLFVVACASCGLAQAQVAAPSEPAVDTNCALKAPPAGALKSRWGAGDVYMFPAYAGKGYTGCAWMWVFRMDGTVVLESQARVRHGRLEYIRSTLQEVPGRLVIRECIYSEGKVLSQEVQPSSASAVCPEAEGIESALEAPPEGR